MSGTVDFSEISGDKKNDVNFCGAETDVMSGS